MELQKIDEAIERVVERYEEKRIDQKVIPSRKFFRLKDLAQFEKPSSLLLLKKRLKKDLLIRKQRKSLNYISLEKKHFRN